MAGASGTSKTGAKVVLLGPEAVEVLQSLQKVEGNPYVIAGEIPQKPFADLQPPWQRIRKKAGLDDVRIHDLRHTFASVAVSHGETLPQELRFSSLPESTRTAIAAGLGIDLERLAIDAEYMRVLPGDAALRAAKTKHHVEYVPRLESSLLASIREGQFAALGYEGPRKLASRLVYIPSTDLRFFTDIDLYTSEIVCQALKFVEVRLVRAGTLDLEFKTATPVAAHSKGPRVVLAYERLLASGGVSRMIRQRQSRKPSRRHSEAQSPKRPFGRTSVSSILQIR